MASGFRKKRSSGDEYVFIDGQAMRAEEAVRIDVSDVEAPGQADAGKQTPADKAKAASSRGKKAKESLGKLNDDDAFALRDDAAQGISFARAEQLMADDRRKSRRKYGIAGIVLLVVILFSLCVSNGYYCTFYSPLEVLQCYAQWPRLTFIQIFDPTSYAPAFYEVLASLPNYADIVSQGGQVLKYLVCGVLLAVSGMLYQNTFRNPIAAPSMLGVSNGVNVALLAMVFIFGTEASQHMDMYYLLTYVAGALVLVLVLFGGKWISGAGRFNVVNMLLIGTIVSQLLGVVISYAQTLYMTDVQWEEFYLLQTASGLDSIWTAVTLALGLAVAIVPVIVYRFRLNLISFSDGEARLLGVDPNKLRVLALACGSLMILTAQVNAGQVAMASLVIPFVVRAVFGAEFRRQLVGNVLVGAILLLVCGDLSSILVFQYIPLDLGTIVSVCTLPLFVWMLAVQQRGWE